MSNKLQFEGSLAVKSDPLEDSEIKSFHNHEEDYSSYPPAKLRTRLLANFIDGIILGIGQNIVMALANKGLASQIQGDQLKQLGLSLSIAYIASFFYIIRPLSKTGQTLGKKIMKIKVVRYQSEESLGVGKVIFREWIMKAVVVILWFISLPMYLFNKEKRVMHDLAVETRVVRINKE